MRLPSGEMARSMEPLRTKAWVAGTLIETFVTSGGADLSGENKSAYEQTRSYVKRVLRSLQAYRLLY